MRRFSLEQDFMNWNIDDILYGLMLYLATYKKETNQLYLSKYQFAKHRQDFYNISGANNSRKLKSHLDKLKEKGLVSEAKVESFGEKIEAYVFPYDAEKNYQLVNNEMLFYIVSTRTKFAVQIYVYLLNKYLWKKKEDDYYIFTNKELQKALGYSSTSNLQNCIISNILESFRREGVIKYAEFYQTKIDNTTGESVRFPQKRLLFVASEKEDLQIVEQ